VGRPNEASIKRSQEGKQRLEKGAVWGIDFDALERRTKGVRKMGHSGASKEF